MQEMMPCLARAIAVQQVQHAVLGSPSIGSADGNHRRQSLNLRGMLNPERSATAVVHVPQIERTVLGPQEGHRRQSLTLRGMLNPEQPDAESRRSLSELCPQRQIQLELVSGHTHNRQPLGPIRDIPQGLDALAVAAADAEHVPSQPTALVPSFGRALIIPKTPPPLPRAALPHELGTLVLPFRRKEPRKLSSGARKVNITVDDGRERKVKLAKLLAEQTTDECSWAWGFRKGREEIVQTAHAQVQWHKMNLNPNPSPSGMSFGPRARRPALSLPIRSYWDFNSAKIVEPPCVKPSGSSKPGDTFGLQLSLELDPDPRCPAPNTSSATVVRRKRPIMLDLASAPIQAKRIRSTMLLLPSPRSSGGLIKRKRPALLPLPPPEPTRRQRPAMLPLPLRIDPAC